MATHTEMRGAVGGQFSLPDVAGDVRCVTCGSEPGYGMVQGKFQRFCPVCDVEFLEYDNSDGTGRGEDEPL